MNKIYSSREWELRVLIKSQSSSLYILNEVIRDTFTNHTLWMKLFAMTVAKLVKTGPSLSNINEAVWQFMEMITTGSAMKRDVVLLCDDRVKLLYQLLLNYIRNKGFYEFAFELDSYETGRKNIFVDPYGSKIIIRTVLP